MGTFHPVHQRQLLSPSLTRISTNHEFVSRHHNAVTAERSRLGPRGEYPQGRATARSRRNQHALRVAPRRTPTPVLLCYAARVLVPAGNQRNRMALPSGSRRAPFRSGRHRTKRASLSLRSIPARREPDRSGCSICATPNGFLSKGEGEVHRSNMPSGLSHLPI